MEELEKGYLSKHFSIDEFRCKCCGLCNVDPKLLELLEVAKTKTKLSLPVISGCRCPKHNKEVGGQEDSRHITTASQACRACDIAIYSGTSRFLLVKTAFDLGFTGIGIHKHYVHLDIGREVTSLWTY